MRGRALIVPENVKLDAKTGELHVLFPKTISIVEAEKEVVFVTRFGAMSIEKRFHLKDMQYKGRLEL